MPSADNSDIDEQHGATWEHQSLAQVKIRVLRGHKDAVNCCSFAFSDSKIVTSSHDRTLRLWDASTGAHLKVYKGHSSFVTCCHTDPNSARIASGGWDKRLIVWDIQTGAILWEALNEGIVTSCHFSHDGRYLANSSDLDFAVSVWDVREGALIKKLFNHKSTVTCCRFSPLQNRICTTSMDRTTKITDMLTFTEDYNVTLTLKGHVNVISSCCFSKDEHLLATGSWDKNIQIWDIATGVYRTQGPITFSKGHEGSVSACNFSEDGSMLVSSSYDESLVIWDVENCCQKFSLKGHSDWVNDCSFSSDQKWIISCSKLLLGTKLEILGHQCHAQTWTKIRSRLHARENARATLHPNKEILKDKTVRMWNIESSDDIPVVLEHRKNIGLRIVQCQNCNKPFSIAQLEDEASHKYCVFCRLEQPTDFSSNPQDY